MKIGILYYPVGASPTADGTTKDNVAMAAEILQAVIQAGSLTALPQFEQDQIARLNRETPQGWRFEVVEIDAVMTLPITPTQYVEPRMQPTVQPAIEQKESQFKQTMP